MKRFFLVMLLAWGGYFASEKLWIRSLPLDVRFAIDPATPAQAAHVGRTALALISMLALAGWAAWTNRRRIWAWSGNGTAMRWTFTLGCSWAIFLALRLQGFEPSWYPLKPLIEHPGTCAIIGHRILFVWPAQLLHVLGPGMDLTRVFMASQALPILAATWLVGKWSGVILGKALGFVGQMLLVLLLCPTFSYYNFYDIAIVGFFCAALLCLHFARFTGFVLVVGLATLNHENAVLLILAAAFAFWPELPLKRWLAIFGSAAALHFAVRGALAWFLPMPRAGDLRIWANPLDLVQMPLFMVMSVVFLAFRTAAIFFAFPQSPKVIRRLGLLFPLLCATTAVFGQFHEARQFDAAIPLEISFVLYYIRALMDGHTSQAASAAG